MDRVVAVLDEQLRLDGLASAVGVRENLAEGVVGEGLGCAVRVIDAQDFAIGFAFEPGGLIQRVGDGNQVLAVVVGLAGALLNPPVSGSA